MIELRNHDQLAGAPEAYQKLEPSASQRGRTDPP